MRITSVPNFVCWIDVYLDASRRNSLPHYSLNFSEPKCRNRVVDVADVLLCYGM